MTMSSLLDAFDAVSHSELLLARLNSAFIELSRKQGLKDEKEWLGAAIERVSAARDGVGDLLTRVMRLPELEAAREEHARTLQNAAVDAVERLQAGITFAGGSRSPLLEAIFGKLKLPVLRRTDREDFEKFCNDFEKRLNSSYAKRMFGEPAFAVVQPAIEQVRQAFAAWKGGFSPEPLGDADAQALRDELDACARRLDLPMRQARLLAEAALSPLKDAYEASGIGAKPKRRTPKPAVTEAIPDEDEAGAEAAEEPPEEPAAEAAPKKTKKKQA